MTLPRRAPLLLAAATAIAGLSWAAAGRLLPASPEALRARDARLVAAAARALERDAAQLARVADRLARDPDLSEVVEGGGAEVRPARVFTALGRALPRGGGWGIVLFDRSRSAVAWVGDAGDVESATDIERPGLVASFHVTRFRIARVIPWGAAADRRGTLVVSRRYPTGILRPDLLEMLSVAEGPSRLRLRAFEARGPGALVSLLVTAPSARARAEDLERCRARPGALLAAAGLAALGLLAGAAPLGLVAARLALALGTPRGGSGVFETLFSAPGLDLLATPADLALTGLVALVLLRALLRRDPPRRLVALRVAFAAALSAGPYLAARAAGLARHDLFDDLSLVPESVPLLLVRVGAVALAAAALGVAARLLPELGRGARRLSTGAAALLLLLALTSGSAPPGFACGLTGSLLAALALARREAHDLLERSAAAVLLAAAVGLAGAAGLAAGNEERMDRAMAREAAAASRPVQWQERARAWSAALAGEGWLPATGGTALSDLARALWVRGATPEFPGLGDVLTIRDASGAVVSSFGVTRPGAAARATTLPVAVPLPGLGATFTHLDDPEEGDRDPLLSSVVARDVPDRVAVERVSFDAAGRSRTHGARSELPPAMLAEARRSGRTRATVRLGDELVRLVVRRTESGFEGSETRAEGRAATLGAALAAAECGLPPLLLVLLAGVPGARRIGRRRAKEPFLATFRARLVALVFLFGALPLAGSVAVVRLALERHTDDETARRARALLAEARRALAPGLAPDETDLSRVASVIGSDLFLYRDGRLAFASRALPVAAEVARDRLSGRVAAALAEGRRDALAPARRAAAGNLRAVEAAESVGERGEALAVVVTEDEAARVAVDGLVLFTFAVAVLAFGLAARAALALSRPLDAVIDSAERLGAGGPAGAIERPAMADLLRLVDAFEAMARRVRERTEMLAREREAAVGLLANLTAAVVLFRERDGAVLLANPAADQLLSGGDLAARLAPFPALAEALAESRARPRPHEKRLSIALGGRERLVRLVVASLPPAEEEERGLLLLEDLTDFVRAERLTAWVDAARAIAHDVKNPLTPIRLAAERILRHGARGAPPPPETLEAAAVGILRQVEILTDRVGRLSRLADPASLDRLPLERDAVARLLAEIAEDFGGGEVRVRVEVDGDLPPVFADRALLRDALANFVLNAVEAMKGRGGEVVLSAAGASLYGGAPAVRLACADDGPGVPAELLPRLFEPAFSTKSRGSGMGLAATRSAVERHGGSVFATPRAGGGLLVGFVLPSSLS